MRKKLLKAVVFLFILGLAGAGALYWTAFKANTPDYEGTRGVKIPRNAGFEEVVDSLAAGGILASRATLTAMASLTGWGGQVKAGHYTFESGVSNYDILSKLRRGLQEPVRVMVPPGVQPEVIAAVMARGMAFSAEELLAALKDPQLAADLGTDTTHLFAYMLPETYFFYWLTDARTVVTRIKEQFDQRYGEELKAEQRLTPDEVLRMASIVEWESHYEPEKPRVAGVYLNRLRDGWPLQADPTVQYAILQAEGQKRRLLFRDYRIDHPYNTYNYRGLPPGPVNNPSPSSINAVLHPEAHRYYYFVAKGDGTHLFSRTLREHNRNAQEYYRLMRQRRAEQSSN